MNYPAALKYSKSHEWVKEEDGVMVIGITDFAQDALGDVVFINLPQEGDPVTAGDSLGDVVFVNLPAEGDSVTAGEPFGDVESVKAVSDLVCPVTGVICAVNEDLVDSPENLNSDPYGAWIIKVESVTATEELLDAADYEAFCAEEG